MINLSRLAKFNNYIFHFSPRSPPKRIYSYLLAVFHLSHFLGGYYGLFIYFY